MLHSHCVCLVLFQEHKALLTGTPLQNTVEELFSLLHFLEPARFPSEVPFMQEFGDLKTEEQVSPQIHDFMFCEYSVSQKSTCQLIGSGCCLGFWCHL